MNRTWHLEVGDKKYTVQSDGYRLYLVDPEDHDEGGILVEWKHSEFSSEAEKIILAALDTLAATNN